MQLVIERLDYFFLQNDQFLFANLDTPLVFDQSYHAIETGWNGLL